MAPTVREQNYLGISDSHQITLYQFLGCYFCNSTVIVLPVIVSPDFHFFIIFLFQIGSKKHYSDETKWVYIPAGG